MDPSAKTVVCPECGEPIAVSLDDIEMFARIVCENCYASLEITEEDPLEVAVVDVDADEFDDEDDLDELDDVDDVDD